MRYLLDTHTLIWFLENDPRLSSKSKELIEDNYNDIFVSVVSLWEINIKISIGRLSLTKSLSDIISELERLYIEILPLSNEHIVGIGKLPFHHRDPFDRMLISQSLSEILPLISKDQNIQLYNADVIW
jgi:PIN domain nuclease of toxin-antitoxin system